MKVIELSPFDSKGGSNSIHIGEKPAAGESSAATRLMQPVPRDLARFQLALPNMRSQQERD